MFYQSRCRVIYLHWCSGSEMSVEANLRSQPRLDFKWLKIDLQSALQSHDGLASLWNGLIHDGELTGQFSDGLLNSSGVTARKGESGKYYCGLRVNRLI